MQIETTRTTLLTDGHNHLCQPVCFHARSQQNVEEEDGQQSAREEHKVSHKNDRADVAWPSCCNVTSGCTLCFLEPASCAHGCERFDNVLRRPEVHPPIRNRTIQNQGGGSAKKGANDWLDSPTQRLHCVCSRSQLEVPTRSRPTLVCWPEGDGVFKTDITAAVLPFLFFHLSTQIPDTTTRKYLSL